MSSVPPEVSKDNQSVTVHFELLPGAPISSGAVIAGCAGRRDLSIPMKEQLLITLRVVSFFHTYVESPQDYTKEERGYQSQLRQAQ